VLPLLIFAGAKMLKLEEVAADQVEAEGHVLVERVAEHVLTCFQSRDPIISLDPVVLGPVAGAEEATSSCMQNSTKIMVVWFQRLLEDA
jgi:hypothetical protein